ncbi:PucR family transcriptional regulator [Streptomyces sp. NPDC006925]|uniref:PucR family transcriptional regulator n=1 Tax=Streptomyces sp. NPDC006925 TaxID=3364768 RepID=UPI00367AA449
MALLISDLVARPELHLSVITGADHIDRPVDAAHASELLRPSAWLQGGELLMTIGLLLPMDPGSCRAYVDDVVGGGARALAVGLGDELPYQEVPQPLVNAAAQAGLPLLTVGRQVPFIAVTKAVFAAQAAEQRAAVESAFATQRSLTAAAASGQGLTPTLDAWTQATGVRAYVTDPLGRVIAVNDTSPHQHTDTHEILIRRVVAGGMRSSAAAPGIEVQPLGARRLRGILVLTGPLPSEARLLVSGLVSLLSLELEGRHLANEPDRRRRAALLGRLLAETTTPEVAADVLADAGLGARSVRAVAIEPPAGATAQDTTRNAADLAADLALAVPGGLTRAHKGLVEAVVDEDLDLETVLTQFAPRRPAGIGSPVPPAAARNSLREATGLVDLSRGTGHPVRARQRRSSDILLNLGPRTALAGFADTLLGPLDTADPTGELTQTLATWLDAACSWDEAARRLAVHRHTVRNRLDKIARLTGRSMDNGDDRFDLWLAIRSRNAAQRASPSRE